MGILIHLESAADRDAHQNDRQDATEHDLINMI